MGSRENCESAPTLIAANPQELTPLDLGMAAAVCGMDAAPLPNTNVWAMRNLR
jgi:hypothetical protein